MFRMNPGFMTVVLDAQAGSSGKGKIAAHIFDTYRDWDFACNAFYPQAGHWVRLGEGSRAYFYQTLNSCAWMWRECPEKVHNKAMYIGPGAIIELPALLKEIEDNHIPPGALFIDRKAAILQPEDTAYERGEVDFAGNPVTTKHEGTMRFGSTSHGVGACAAKRVLRDPRLVTAGDYNDTLGNFLLDDVSKVLLRKVVSNKEHGVLEIAQGFQLSIGGRFFPHTTSRNCTVAQGFSDMFLPTTLLGNVVLNLRTFPIRINSNKYLSKLDGHHLTYEEILNGVPYDIYKGDSGGWYPDQKEISWDQLTKDSGSSIPLMELTSVTKLPRRVATFSKLNLLEAIENSVGRDKYMLYLSLNFANYVDSTLTGATSVEDLASSTKFIDWVRENLGDLSNFLQWVGTGPYHHQIVDFFDLDADTELPL